METTKSVDKSLIMKRLAALEKGEFTDCSFLVGSEDQDHPLQKIHACKFDLMVASEYFHPLLTNPNWNSAPGEPIRIKNMDPEIFKLIVEFTHLSGQLVTQVKDLVQWLKLAQAADEFLLDDLGHLCTEKLEEFIALDNVWTVFNQNHLVRFSSAACEKLLRSETEECLKQLAFYEIDEHALAKFLSFGSMSIKSEMQLVNACLEFVKCKNIERAVFRRCVLPHLRLLTLSADDDLSQLTPFLDKDEEMFLFLNLHMKKDPLKLKNENLDTRSLCKELELRHPVQIAGACDINKQRIVDFAPDFKFGYQDNPHYLRYELNVKAHRSIIITGFDILGQISQEAFSFNKESVKRNFSSWTYVLPNVFEQPVSWLAGNSVNVYVPGKNFSYKNLEPTKFSKLWTHFETSILVLKGEQITLCVQSSSSNHYFVCTQPIKDVSLPEVTCTCNATYIYGRPENFNIVKCFYFKNVNAQ